MKLDIGGKEKFAASQRAVDRVERSQVLTRCIPGCTSMTAIAPDAYKVEMS